MNKVLHVLVYVFLVLAGAALYFELQLNDKRALLTDRNRLQEDYLVKIARTVEKADPSKDVSFEIKKDATAVEARIVDSPDMENVLEDYPASLEQANLETFNWDNQSERQQLRQVYVLDFEGKPVMDGNQPLMRGKGTEDELLSQLFEAAKTQQSRLNTTRAALTDLRAKLEATVAEINKLKPEARQDKITIEELRAKLSKIETEKNDVANQVTKIKGQIDERDAEITSLKDEVATAKDEKAAAEEKIVQTEKMVAQLKKLLQESIQTQGTASSASGVTTVTALSNGTKGKVVVCDNENMFAIIELTKEALDDLKGGPQRDKPMPALDLGVKRTGFKGAAGEFVGRVRLRQEVKGKNYVVCDILGSWEQDKLQPGDEIFAD